VNTWGAVTVFPSPPEHEPTSTIIVSRQPCRRHRHGRQIRTGLVPLGCVDDFRVDWQWIPAWRPAGITDSGREQLRAIGFTI
jgi:hypothetical protein